MYSKVTKGLIVGLIIYVFSIICGGVFFLFGDVDYCIALSTVIFTAGIAGILCGKHASSRQAIKAGAKRGGTIGILVLFSQLYGQTIRVNRFGFGLIFPIGKYNTLLSLLNGIGLTILVWLLLAIVLINVGVGIGTLLAKIASRNTQKSNNLDTSTVWENSRRIWLLLLSFCLLFIASDIIFNTWLTRSGDYPNGRLLTSYQTRPWAFCVEEDSYRFMDCSIGVKLIMVFEAPVEYSQVENWYRGRYGQIGEFRRNESGIRLRYGPEPQFWDKSEGPIELYLGVEKPQFSPNMTPFYVTEEYSVYFRLKH